MNKEEMHKILMEKPNLTNVKDRVKYAVFAGLVQRGWFGVGASYSGVLTKNDFVLTLYKSDASNFVLSQKTDYVVPAAITCFIIPNAGWTLERYNKLYASGKIQSMWEYLYEQPELISESESFVKFLNDVDRIANLPELELQSLGELYASDGEEVYSFEVYNGPITDTGIFLSMKDFDSVNEKTVYQILTAKEENDERFFVLRQMQPASVIEITIGLEAFNEHYRNRELIPLTATKVNSGNYTLVPAGGSSMSGLPAPLRALGLSLDKQQVLGKSIIERLYILPLLFADDGEILQCVYDILSISHEYDLLNHLPNDIERLKIILEYARAGLSIYQPLTSESVGDSEFELNEIVENMAYDRQELGSVYDTSTIELINFTRTFYMTVTPKPNVVSNYMYLQMLYENNILLKLCSSMLHDTLSDSAGVLYLHKVYLNYDAQNEIRAYFGEEGMEQLLEKSLTDCIHVSFDWRTGFGLDCPKYVLVRVPGGYKLLNNERCVEGFVLKINNEVFSYGNVAFALS